MCEQHLALNNRKTNPLVDLFILKYLLFSFIGQKNSYIYIYIMLEDVNDLRFSVVGNEHCDTCSNPGRDCLHFT